MLRRLVIGLLSAMIGLFIVPTAATAQQQVLTWTAGNSVTQYLSAPATAVAGTATVIFDNSRAAGNTTGMPHTLTFDTTTPGYNHDVDLNITANPYDENGGYYEAEITLTPGTYRYHCVIPGHGMMVGELVVTADGGDPDPDTTAPEVAAAVTGQQDDDGDYLGSAEVAITATDAGSGVDAVEYSLDGGEFLAYDGPVAVTEIGGHTVDYRATDVAGNTAEGSVSFTIVEDADPDTTAPEVAAAVTGEQNDDGDYVGWAEVAITATDADSGVAAIEYSLDGGEYTHYHMAVVVAEVGGHTVDYRATDVAGNTAEGGVSFTIVEEAGPDPDTTAPEVGAEVAGERNDDGDYVGSVEVAITATDAGSGVDAVEYSLDGGEFLAYDGPVAVTEAGGHTVDYRATDVAGNTAEGRVSFTIVEEAGPDPDTTAPEVGAEVAGERNDDGDYVGSVEVAITATDEGSGVDAVEYSLDGGEFLAYDGPVAVTEVGGHTVDYRATDVAGNTAEGGVSFTIVQEGEPGDCPDGRATVTIDGIDTGVANADLGDGCTINDLIDEAGDYENHGQFVRHVGDVVRPLADDGILTQREVGAILRAAARSQIGR
ncbi:copper-binding protein [Pseudactinotalea sp. HY160]|uniref:OmpL47-type beta-barrel domain-containing protein n=1 Tax=Pseudactinotalea sp. HY160 TaxID=2654490 RepID=UPI001313A4DE|nr:copper-binding protein [Pseudactinotalea sp. HY160]MPV50573.1 copper-binding protein [Pseudactinotalea sp. HY160]